MLASKICTMVFEADKYGIGKQKTKQGFSFAVLRSHVRISYQDCRTQYNPQLALQQSRAGLP